jgi:hypothetical protein
MVAESVERIFPNLAKSGYEITSPKSKEYNCIAWAAKEDFQPWWPVPWENSDCYWPENAPKEETLEAFIKAFETMGYRKCADDRLESGYEKVAIYADENGYPLHMARQLYDGKWTSKLGREGFDIVHNSLDGLTNSRYGKVAQTLKRKIE